MNSNNSLILIVAVVALLGGGLFFSGVMKGGGGFGGERALKIAALSPEKKAQAARAVDRVHETDKETIARALEAQAAVLKTIGAEPVQRRKLCITGLIESKAPLEEVDPAAGLATELASECSTVVGWMEKLGGFFGGDPNAEKLQRVANLWGKYFIKPDDLTRRLSIEVETAILELQARRHGFVSGLGGRSWAELQSQLKGAEATLLGPATRFTARELQQLKQAGSEPDSPYRTVGPGKRALSITNDALEEAASTMGLELELSPAQPEKRPVGADAWASAIARAVLAAANSKPKSAADFEASIRETLAVANREAEKALRRRLTERLAAQQASERAVIDAAATPGAEEETAPPSKEQADAVAY